MVIVPTDLNQKEAPENFATIARYLEAHGKVKHLSYAQQLKARSMFIRGKSIMDICEATELQPHMVDRLSVINGWEEERDKRLLSSFRRINGLAKRLAPDVDERHDRIAGSIEAISERLIHQHQDGGLSLCPADIKRLAEVLKTTVDIRRTIRGQKGSTHETKHTHRLELPDEIEAEKLATALSAVISGRPPKQLAASTKRVEVEIGEGIGFDTEFEG